MDVIDRVQIEPTTGCPYIPLTEPEKDIYKGAGEHLAAFDGRGRLVELWDVHDQVDMRSPDEDANAILGLAANWVGAQQAKGRTVYAVMCSCFDLCEPECVDLPQNAARLARWIGDAVAAAWADE